MRARIALTAVCVTTSTVLLLSGCGSDSKKTDKIQDSQSGSPPTSAPVTTSPTATPAAGRPTITFPSYAKNVFEDQSTGNAQKDAILADNAQWVDSMDDAIFQGTAKTKALGYYSTGKGLELALTYVNGYIKDGSKWAGTTRFFDRKATVLGGGTASVVYCSDESKSYITNPKKPTKHTPTSADSYVLYNAHMKKNAQGV